MFSFLRNLTDFAKGFSAIKYYLFQESCRVCGRFIHPEIAFMTLNEFCPPATYQISGKQLVCECLCRSCWPILRRDQPSCRTYEDVRSAGVKLTVASGTSFEGEIKKLVYKFKYDGDLLLASDLAIFALIAWEKLSLQIDPANTYLVPVPLHKTRLYERGFNQSEQLGTYLGKSTGVRLKTRALKRIKKTLSQQSLGKWERLDNVKGAFQANAQIVDGKQIILIDDVCTSGATLLECARMLYIAGAKEVLAVTLAKVDW